MPKAVRVIPAKPEYSGKSNADFRPKRVAAYCRVSTDKEEQEHSFETLHDETQLADGRDLCR